jgi:succinate-acetate transporter protein
MVLDAVLGLAAAWLTARLLNLFRLSQYFYHPPLVLIALAVIYTGLFSIFLLPG